MGIFFTLCNLYKHCICTVHILYMYILLYYEILIQEKNNIPCNPYDLPLPLII